MPKKGDIQDLTNCRFGFLTATRYSHTIKYRHYWLCKCDCGKETTVASGNLKSHSVVSCGCLRRKAAIKNGKKAAKHGLRHSRLYNIYYGMRYRCMNKNARGYERYGGRGITICKEWLDEGGFVRFYNWAIQNGYQEGLSIDRINNDAGYSPDNCRWATMKQQANNMSTNKNITCMGETRTISEWADKYGINRKTLEKRLNSYHWSIEKALKIPVLSG